MIEADEYDTAFFDKRSKFVHYRPRTAILNNLEFDHADIFDDLAAIERQFHHLVRTVPAAGRVVVNGLEESLARVLRQGCWSEVRSFGARRRDFAAQGAGRRFDVLLRGAAGRARAVGPGGVHNQLNALAAIAAAEHAASRRQMRRRAGQFRNVRRRMEVRGRWRAGGEITVYDDFAHHPRPSVPRLTGCGGSWPRQARRPHPGCVRAAQQHHETGSHEGPAALEPGAGRPGVLPQRRPGLGCRAKRFRWARGPGGRQLDALVAQVVPAARPGDHIVCMSNGGFGGIHARLLDGAGAGLAPLPPLQGSAATAAHSSPPPPSPPPGLRQAVQHLQRVRPSRGRRR